MSLVMTTKTQKPGCYIVDPRCPDPVGNRPFKTLAAAEARMRLIRKTCPKSQQEWLASLYILER